MTPSAMPSPLQELQLRLAPVRRRLAVNAVLLACARGLWLGATIALWLALLMWLGRELGNWPGTYRMLWPGGAAIAVILGLLLGACIGFRNTPTWLSVAATVDAHFGLRDAVIAGMQFAERAGETGLRPMEAMQVAQTLRTLDQLDLCAAAHLRIPRSVFGGAASLAMAAALFSWVIWLGPPQEQPVETMRQPEVAIRSPAERPPAADPAPPRETMEQLRAAVQWQVAPRAEVRTGIASPGFDEAFEQAVRAADAHRPAGETSSAPTQAPDRIPPEYAPIVRRYFQRDWREK